MNLLDQASMHPENWNEGQDLGVSDWVRIDQAMIASFGSATLDPDPMHVDPEWAQVNSPFGSTIAFGFLTISLLTHLLHTTLGSSSTSNDISKGHYLNYGFDRIRLVKPVIVGSRIRGRFRVSKIRRYDPSRRVAIIACEVEIEDSDRPALVADWLTAWVPVQS